MSANLLPDHWPLLQVGETINARLTPAQLKLALREAERRGFTFTVEPAQHYWLTVTAKFETPRLASLPAAPPCSAVVRRGS